jgi:2-iminobutanoate/2-iminopropanoate deaminase
MKTSLQAAGAPNPVGPYSHAQLVHIHGQQRMLFTSGQVAIDPTTGKLTGEDVATQTAQVFRNLSAVLSAGDLTLADVVKTTVFLVDMADFKVMNEVYARHFSGSFPARSTVAVRSLPLDARVEIEAVAVGGDR